MKSRSLTDDTPWRRREKRTKLTVIALVFLGSALIALQASQTILELLLALLSGLAATLVFLRWPALGVAMIPLASLLVPVNIGVSSGSSLNAPMLLIILLIGLWLFDMFARQRRIFFVRSRPFAPLAIFILVSILAFVFGQLPWFFFAQKAPLTAQLGGLAIFLLSAFAFLLAAHQIKDLAWLKGTTWLFLAAGAVYVAGQLFPGARRVTNRLFQYGAASNSLFWTWMVVLSFGQAFFNRRLHTGWRFALGGLGLATLYLAYVIVSGWKSGWVPAAVGLAILIVLWSGRLGVALITGGAFLIPTVLSQLVATDKYSYSTRIEAWLILAEIVKANPLLGLGPSNYYWYTPLYSIRGYSVQFNSHNQYVDLVAQTGLLGLASFVWFAVEVGRLGWGLRNRVPEGFARAYVYAALAGLGGMLTSAMLGDWVLPFVYNVGFAGFRGSVIGWLFLGGLVALEQILPNQEEVLVQ